jgi:hypothetical protein
MAPTWFISSELWEVQSTDPATFAGVSVPLIAVALLACDTSNSEDLLHWGGSNLPD